MLKGSQITAFALTLASIFVTISTKATYAGQTAEGEPSIINESGLSGYQGKPCGNPKKCPPCPRKGCVPPPQLPPIEITRPELNDVTSVAAIEKLEALKASGQATNDDYVLLGYFYSLEKKYDQSEVNYLTALKLATDDGRKDIIKKELEKLRAVTSEVKPVDK